MDIKPCKGSNLKWILSHVKGVIWILQKGVDIKPCKGSNLKWILSHVKGVISSGY